MKRHELSDQQWDAIKELLPAPKERGRKPADPRLMLNGMLWIVRTGAPWRDLPECFGNWLSVWKRFRRWALKGVFEAIFKELSGDPDFEYALIDGTIVKVHRHGTGAKGGLKIRPSASRAAV